MLLFTCRVQINDLSCVQNISSESSRYHQASSKTVSFVPVALTCHPVLVMASFPVLFSTPGAPRQSGYTSVTRSGTFHSPMFNGFIEATQQSFVAMVTLLGGHIQLFAAASVLQLNLVIGPDHSIASTVTAEPLTQPRGRATHHSNSFEAHTLIGRQASQFIGDISARFQPVVNRLCTRAALLVIDLRIGDGYHMNTVLRMAPQSTFVPLPSPNENDDDDDHDGGDSPSHAGAEDCPPAVPTTVVVPTTTPAAVPASVALTPLGAAGSDGSHDLDSGIMFAAPPPGAIAAFVNRFFNPTLSHVTTANSSEVCDDDDKDEFDDSVSDMDDIELDEMSAFDDVEEDGTPCQGH